jgi:pilus assembly protein TadC
MPAKKKSKINLKRATVKNTLLALEKSSPAPKHVATDAPEKPAPIVASANAPSSLPPSHVSASHHAHPSHPSPPVVPPRKGFFRWLFKGKDATSGPKAAQHPPTKTSPSIPGHAAASSKKATAKSIPVVPTTPVASADPAAPAASATPQKHDYFAIRRQMEMREKRKRDEAKKVRNRQLLRAYLDKAGYEDLDEDRMSKMVFRIVIGICLAVSFFALVIASITKPGIGRPVLFLVGIWTGVFAGLFVLSWIFIYIFLDMRVFSRTLEVEEVLPDYLQLASANISAGMPIDQALWYAVRPKFGILAKEIEEVAKSTASGEDLKAALMKFSDKYDSVMLKRSISLILEGMESGGEMAELLNKVAMNIQETRIIKKEMAANVMTYAIFIGFATIVAAPILFGLSGQLLIIIQDIMGMLAQNGDSGGGMFALDMTANSITVRDFRIFSVATLTVTAIFSACIVSIIRKGNVKEGLRYLPMFVLATLALYFLSSWLLSILLGGMLAI